MLFRHKASGGVIDADASQREHLIIAGFEPIETKVEEPKAEKPKPEAPPTRKKQVRKEV